jgi:hypothetical protein
VPELSRRRSRTIGPEHTKRVVRVESTTNQGRPFGLAPETKQNLAFYRVGMRETRAIPDAHEEPSGFGKTVARRC